MSKRDMIDGYPKIKAWMEECSKADGIKEVHLPWAAEGGPLPTIVGIMSSSNADKQAAVEQKLKQFGQEHVLSNLDKLTTAQKNSLLDEVQSIDLECVANLHRDLVLNKA